MRTSLLKSAAREIKLCYLKFPVLLTAKRQSCLEFKVVHCLVKFLSTIYTLHYTSVILAATFM